MSAADVDVIRWGRERVRTAPWRGDRNVASLTPMPDAPVPSSAFVRHCLDQLAARGFARVITSALSPAEQGGFLGAGFEVHEHLHLLAHDLRHIPRVDTPGLRRARARDHPAVLAVDRRAFPSFWRIDEASLGDALRATPNSRFRVATVPSGVVAYAVTGRSGRRGFLQRLAVEPDHQRHGVGRALAVDALRWLRRWRVEQAVVNTQTGNRGALALYESLGFRREAAGLSVLSAVLPDGPTGAPTPVSSPRRGPQPRPGPLPDGPTGAPTPVSSPRRGPQPRPGPLPDGPTPRSTAR